MAHILFYPVGDNVQDLVSEQEDNTQDSIEQQTNPITGDGPGGQAKP